MATSVVSPATSKVLRQNDVATDDSLHQNDKIVNNSMEKTPEEQYSFFDTEEQQSERGWYANPALKPKNKAHKGVKYWYKFKNEIVFDGVPYTVIFNIRDKGGEQYQYLIDFKENKTPGLSNTAVKNLLRADQMSYADIVSSPANAVNRKNADTPDGKYSFSDTDDVEGQYSFSGADDPQSERGWYATDEKELQARRKGYPVLHGEQVVPFRTWVKAKDRENYGLVTGMGPAGRLLVSFYNKETGKRADDLALPTNQLVPVSGEYQMTDGELAALMESERWKCESFVYMQRHLCRIAARVAFLHFWGRFAVKTVRKYLLRYSNKRAIITKKQGGKPWNREIGR